MLTTLVVMETMNSWRPSDSITVRECVRLHGPLKPEPLNGSQPVRPGKRSMQTPQWGSGAWMRSKVQIVTALTMRSASSVLKVCSFFPETTFTNFFFSIFWCLHNYLCFLYRFYCEHSGYVGPVVRLDPLPRCLWPGGCPNTYQRLPFSFCALHWTQSWTEGVQWTWVSDIRWVCLILVFSIGGGTCELLNSFSNSPVQVVRFTVS